MNVESNDFIFKNPYQEPNIIYVTSEHPTYDFQIRNLVVMMSEDQDPFWLAQVMKVDKNSLEVVYFHHSPFRSGKKLVWKPHNSNGTCGKYDVYIRFKGEEQLFTKEKTILKKALKKIAQACLTYNNLEIPETFK
jgi:hypothetical protein